MKVGDDAGKPYRQQLIHFDRIEERSERFATRALIAILLYLFGHIVYALYN